MRARRPIRIALLCADVSRNAFGRAYVLARALAASHEVHVLGPQFGDSVWPPMKGELEAYGIKVTAIPARPYPAFLAAARQLWRAINADILYALKPFPTSFGIGLLFRAIHHTPLLLDIDDWELGNYRAMGRFRVARSILSGALSPNNYVWLRLLYGMVPQADAITVASSWLRQRFGGVIVPHARDTDAIDPTLVDGQSVRETWGLEGRLVMFLGTLRPHKGIEDFIAAMRHLARQEVQGVIVGADPRDPYSQYLRDIAGEHISLLPLVPFSQMPAFLAAAEVIVIPQRQTPFSQAQVPAKLFDAMAMGRPIVSTAVSDIPAILENCGVVVPPGDVAALSAAIAYLLDHPAKASMLGNAARRKCVEKFSLRAASRVLEETIEQVLAANGSLRADT